MPRPIVQDILLNDKTKAGFNSLTRNLSKVSGAFAAIGAAVTTGALGKLTTDALKSADEIQKLSQRLGASTEALSQYRLVADLTGVSFRTLTTGLQRMTRRISEAANGTGEAQNALKELGLEATALNELRPEEQFEILADAINNLGSSSDKVRVAVKLFDSEGAALLQTIQGGSAAIRDMRQQADDLGQTLTQEAADGAAAALSAITKLAAGGKALGLTLARALAPVITSVVNWLQVSLPNAVQFAADAFFQLQSFVLSAGSTITSGLSRLSGSLATAAGFFGADQIQRALQKTADGYAAVSSNLEKASIRVGNYVGSNETLVNSLEIGVTFNQLYNAELAKGLSTTEAATTARRKLAQATEELSDPAQEYIDNLQREIDVLGLANDELIEYELRLRKATPEQIKFALALNEEREAFEAINAVEQENQRLMEASQRALEQQATAIEKNKALSEELGPILGSAFEDAIVEGNKFSDVLKGLEKDLIRVFTRRFVTKPLTDAFGNLFSSGGGFDFSKLFTRAIGGPVSAGRPYIVGERGPEMFMPATAGRIIPANETNQGGVYQFHFHDVKDVDTFRRSQRMLSRWARTAVAAG